MGGYERGRPFLPLQGLAFRGEVVERPQLRFRGLELSSFPSGFKSLSLKSALYYWAKFSLERTRIFDQSVRKPETNKPHLASVCGRVEKRQTVPFRCRDLLSAGR